MTNGRMCTTCALVVAMLNDEVVVDFFPTDSNCISNGRLHNWTVVSYNAPIVSAAAASAQPQELEEEAADENEEVGEQAGSRP